MSGFDHLIAKNSISFPMIVCIIYGHFNANYDVILVLFTIN